FMVRTSRARLVADLELGVHGVLPVRHAVAAHPLPDAQFQDSRAWVVSVGFAPRAENPRIALFDRCHQGEPVALLMLGIPIENFVRGDTDVPEGFVPEC